MWCHSWHSSGSQGDTATAVCHITLPKPAQGASQQDISSASRDLQEIGMVCALDPNYLLSWDTGLICTNRLGTARDKDKGHLNRFPSVETLCSFAGCYSRTIATLRQAHVPSSQLHFSCSGNSHLYPKAGRSLGACPA